MNCLDGVHPPNKTVWCACLHVIGWLWTACVYTYYIREGGVVYTWPTGWSGPGQDSRPIQWECCENNTMWVPLSSICMARLERTYTTAGCCGVWSAIPVNKIRTQLLQTFAKTVFKNNSMHRDRLFVCIKSAGFPVKTKFDIWCVPSVAAGNPPKVPEGAQRVFMDTVLFWNYPHFLPATGFSRFPWCSVL